MLEIEPLTTAITQVDDLVINLTEVLPDTQPESMEGQKNILCLDVNKFGLDQAIAWVRTVRAYSTLPMVLIVVTDSSLSRSEIKHRTDEIGGTLWKSYDRSSFEVEFKKIAQAISKKLNRPKKSKISAKKPKLES